MFRVSPSAGLIGLLLLQGGDEGVDLALSGLQGALLV